MSKHHRYREEVRRDVMDRILKLYPTNLAPYEFCNTCRNQCAKRSCAGCDAINSWPPSRYEAEVVGR